MQEDEVPTDMTALDFVLSHVLLPPKLPQHEYDEEKERKGQCLLLRLVREGVECFVAQCCSEMQVAWRPVLAALESMETLTMNIACEPTLERILRGLEPTGMQSKHYISFLSRLTS